MSTMSTNTAAEFRRHLDETGALPPGCMLGYIVYSTVEEAPYDAAVMENLFIKLGLNSTFLPGQINPHDAFEKATTACAGFKYETHAGHLYGQHTAEILIREAVRDKNTIVRKLIREIKDAKGKRLDYTEVGEFAFYRPAITNGVVDHRTATVRTTLSQHLHDKERELLVELVRKFDQQYLRFRDFHDGQRVRKIIRDYLLHLNAIQMKPSVYFVHNSRAAELESLQGFVNALHPNGRTSMSLLPIPELQAMRQEVIEAFEREAEEALLGVVTEIQKLRRTRKGPIKPDAFGRIKEKYDDVINKAREHSRTLQVGQDRTGAAAELALNALVALQADVIEAVSKANVDEQP